MIPILYEMMKECKNFFVTTSESGVFKLERGQIVVKNKYMAGQYVAISGSVLNNGVYRVESVLDGVISFVVDNAAYPKWIQPMGAHDAYIVGDKVTHNNNRYISLINANIWEPGSDPRWWEKIHDSPEEHMTVDEEFEGIVYGLRVPRDFLALADEIAAHIANAPLGGYTHESFGAHSYSLATNARGVPAAWNEVYAERLNPYRKMFLEVRV